jgi:hypothetical protein
MDAGDLIIVLVCLIVIAGMAFWSGLAGKVSGVRARFMCIMALVLSPVTLVFFITVITARVPGAVKDGLFGGAGGLVLGTLICNMLMAGALLGKVWGEQERRASDEKEAEKKDTSSVSAASAKAEWPSNLPLWLHRTSHSLNGLCVGSLIGILLLVVMRGKELSSVAGISLGMMVAVGAIYCGSLAHYLLGRVLARGRGG